MTGEHGFLPMTRTEMDERGWGECDFIVITGDAYVDHPSFGTAIISRVVESIGFRVGIIAQPDWRSTEDIKRLGKPLLGFLINAGNMDSMVANYSVAHHKRKYDYYTPGGVPGHRPDRATNVYCNLVRQAYGRDMPVIVGGIEVSLRRFAHYDYWSNTVRASALAECGADLLIYGMGERALREITLRLAAGENVHEMRDIRGTCYLAEKEVVPAFEAVKCASYEKVRADKPSYASAVKVQYEEHDAVRGRAIMQAHGDRMLVQNPPQPPLNTEELDEVFALPYERTYHPSYEAAGGIPAISEVEFSITHNRGCFGGCNFCAIAFHQGRTVTARSEESILEEARLMTQSPHFKGYIHDIGGPTADFRIPSCKKQLKLGVCKDRKCLAPRPCPHLQVDHSEYAEILRKVEALPGVKKVFVRSGIRFDYLMLDRDDSFFRQLVDRHVSGQLRVAPEHCADNALCLMGKPEFSVYRQFCRKFSEITRECGKEQYVVPYLMSSHPGSTLDDAIELALYLKEAHLSPEQVQDFYPTPGTVSTCMYYTGIDPMTMKPVYVATGEEKAMQRALLQVRMPENQDLARRALRRAGREDLIGRGPNCLVPPEPAGKRPQNAENGDRDGHRRPEPAHAPNRNSRDTRPQNGPKENRSKRTYAPDFQSDRRNPHSSPKHGGKNSGRNDFHAADRPNRGSGQRNDRRGGRKN